MATLGQTALTLADWAKRTDPNGNISTVVEILNDQNEVLDDMLWLPGNLETGHKTTVRTGLPTVAWRLLNYGVPASKSRTVQVTDSCGMLEGYGKVDKALADLNGNTPEFRLSEDKPFLEAMNQEFVETLFYGNTAIDQEKFLGLSARYSSVGAENGGNIVSAGANATGNTSIWLVLWGDQTCHGIFPKNGKAGLMHEDLGEDTLVDAAGGEYQGYRSHFKWDCGFSLRDWRFVVRIANIQVAALTKNAATGADLIDKITEAIEIPPNLKAGRAAIYCNRTVKSFLRRQISNKSNVNLTLDTAPGKHVLSFDGIPVRRCDAILNTEAQVT